MLTAAFERLGIETAARVQRSQVDSIYEHVARAAVISSVLAIALAVYLTPKFGSAQTHTWLALKLAVSGIRFAMAIAYKRTNAYNEQHGFAHKSMLLALALDGAVWGFAGVWGARAETEVACLIVACLASVALMATHGLGSDVRATVAYVAPMLLPVVLAMPTRGDGLGLFGAAGTALVLVQSITTGLTAERRLHREVKSHDALEAALMELSLIHI